MINDKPAKASTNVKVGDVIAISFGNKEVKVEVLPVQDIDKTERLSDKTERLNNASNGSAAMLVNIEPEPVDDLLPYEISNNQEAVSQQQVSQQPVSNPYVSQKPMESVSSMKPASLQADFAKAMEPVKVAQSSPTSATAAISATATPTATWICCPA